MRQVVLLSGRTCNGKSKLAALLKERSNFRVFKTSKHLQKIAEKRGISIDRNSLKKLGDTLDEETKHKWILEEIQNLDSRISTNKPIVVDNVRNFRQLKHFRDNLFCETIHVHLYARGSTLANRFEKRQRKRRKKESATTHKQADLIKSDDDIKKFKADADVRVFTDRTDAEDTFVRVTARLGLMPPPNRQCVDVLIGGQFGSEGKGQVAAYLAQEYDVLMRVGGPNAGHTAARESGKYTYHSLPSGCRDTDAEILIGPGATIYVPDFLNEVEQCKIKPERLFVDPQAMIISEADKNAEADLTQKIGSTGSGSGAAAARRIMGRLGSNDSACLARNTKELSEFVRSTQDRLQKAYLNGERVLLEGTQGSGLSVYHGVYPYVTSRDTNVSGCLAEAGIPPRRVRQILMVVRYTPIRVESPKDRTSGPLKHETTFEKVAEDAGLKIDLQPHERTSTTHKPRRVGWFDWGLFRTACALNVPTDIVLTFADYHKAENQNARRFEQLHTETIKFIEELERVAQAPVSLINTRFPHGEEKPTDLRTIIDRRAWKAHSNNNSR